MKQHNLIVYVIAALLVLAGCTATKTTSSNQDASTSSAPASEQDGSSFEKAIVVKSIEAEYAWIRKNYPGSKVNGQALLNNKNKYYDKLNITTAAGEKKDIYFDINSFFGKF